MEVGKVPTNACTSGALVSASVCGCSSTGAASRTLPTSASTQPTMRSIAPAGGACLTLAHLKPDPVPLSQQECIFLLSLSTAGFVGEPYPPRPCQWPEDCEGSPRRGPRALPMRLRRTPSLRPAWEGGGMCGCEDLPGAGVHPGRGSRSSKQQAEKASWDQCDPPRPSPRGTMAPISSHSCTPWAGSFCAARNKGQNETIPPPPAPVRARPLPFCLLPTASPLLPRRRVVYFRCGRTLHARGRLFYHKRKMERWFNTQATESR